MVHTCPSCGTKTEGDSVLTCPDCGKSMDVRRTTRLLGENGEIEVDSGLRPAVVAPKSSAPQIPKSIEHYEIIKPIASGGMGSVFLSYESLLDRQVALKLLLRDADDAHRAEDSARFLSEAVLTGRLTHAGIVPIYHVGFDPVHGYYYTMRYIKGRTLADIIARLAANDPAAVEEFRLNRLLSIILRVCEAIGFAHSQGIVHRDIKPSNVIVAEFGEVLVLDWGLAKNTRPDDEHPPGDDPEADAKLKELRRKRTTTSRIFLLKDRKLPPGTALQHLHSAEAAGKIVTRSDQVLGTPGYLSPEQGAGEVDVTPASDVYSLGVTLYELLTYALPIDTEDPQELIRKTVHGELVPLQKRTRAFHLPKVLTEIVNRCLSLDPKERYKNATEMAGELWLYLEGKAAWKPVTADNFSSEKMSSQWTVLKGSARCSSEGLVVDSGTSLRNNRVSLGDLRCALEFWAESGSERWVSSFGVSEVLADGVVEPRYTFRVGVEERPFVELLRNGRRVQRRFDVRLQAAQRYTIQIEMEQDHLVLSIDGRKYIDFREVFPQTGGAFELHAPSGRLYIKQFELSSRGAPLNLSYMVLPDRLYRMGRFAEARELYRQLTISHPDREEGLIALYKAGLCSTSLDDLQSAFQDFTKLEGTMYDHCCALGLAQIGLRDRNIDWAWGALKNGYKRHRLQAIRSEIWFALLSLIEHLEPGKSVEKIKRYRELISDLDPEPQEAGQITFDLLDLIQQSSGPQAVRAEALGMLQRFPDNGFLMGEALLALCRAGIDDTSIEPVSQAIDRALKLRNSDTNVARFHILRAEIYIAQGKLEDGFRQLRDSIMVAGPGSPEGQWAKCWQVLIQHLNGQYQQTLTEVHEVLVRFRKSKTKQHGYFRFLEALGYLGKGNPQGASNALKAAAEIDCIWGRAAAHYLAAYEPRVLIQSSPQTGPNQITEALFLVGEAHLLARNNGIARIHFQACLEPARERAMISRFAKARVAKLLAQ